MTDDDEQGPISGTPPTKAQFFRWITIVGWMMEPYLWTSPPFVIYNVGRFFLQESPNDFFFAPTASSDAEPPCFNFCTWPLRGPQTQVPQVPRIHKLRDFLRMKWVAYRRAIELGRFFMFKLVRNPPKHLEQLRLFVRICGSNSPALAGRASAARESYELFN